jgi:hypothetical protein
VFIDQSGLYPRPSVGRTSAPRGHTPILRPWWTRDQLSAISALSLTGQRSFHYQDRARNSVAVVAFLEPLLREGAGRLLSFWDGAPMPRRHLMQACLAPGAAARMQRERLPA